VHSSRMCSPPRRLTGSLDAPVSRLQHSPAFMHDVLLQEVRYLRHYIPAFHLL